MESRTNNTVAIQIIKGNSLYRTIFFNRSGNFLADVVDGKLLLETAGIVSLQFKNIETACQFADRIFFGKEQKFVLKLNQAGNHTIMDGWPEITFKPDIKPD